MLRWMHLRAAQETQFSATTGYQFAENGWSSLNATAMKKIVGKLMIIHQPWGAKYFMSNKAIWYLVGGWPIPLKSMKVSWDDDIPNIWENKTSSKPPTKYHMDVSHESSKQLSFQDRNDQWMWFYVMLTPAVFVCTFTFSVLFGLLYPSILVRIDWR